MLTFFATSLHHIHNHTTGSLNAYRAEQRDLDESEEEEEKQPGVIEAQNEQLWQRGFDQSRRFQTLSYYVDVREFKLERI